VLMLPCGGRLALDVTEHRTTAEALPHIARGPAVGSGLVEGKTVEPFGLRWVASR
jgi:hypothetical protein